MTTLQIIIICTLFAFYHSFGPVRVWASHVCSFISGFVVGLVLGDWRTGVIIGAAIQTLNMSPVTTGASNNYDLRTASYVAIPLAMAGNLSTELALTIAVPFAVLGTFFTPIERTVNSVVAMLGDKAAAKGSDFEMGLALHLAPWLNFPIRFIPLFIVLYFGQTAIDYIVNNVPQWILDGFSLMGGVLPAVGFALFLSVLGKKSLLPYFFAGYYIAYAFGLSTILMAIFGVIIAILHMMFTGSNNNMEGEAM